MDEYKKNVLPADGEYERAEKLIKATVKEKKETLDWLIGLARIEERTKTINEIIECVQENHKGTFTDNGGNDCWYISDLVKALQHMLKPTQTAQVHDE